MAIEYKKLTEAELETFVDMRIAKELLDRVVGEFTPLSRGDGVSGT